MEINIRQIMKTKQKGRTRKELIPMEEGIQWRVCVERKTRHGCSYLMQLEPCRMGKPSVFQVQEDTHQD